MNKITDIGLVGLLNNLITEQVKKTVTDRINKEIEKRLGIKTKNYKNADNDKDVQEERQEKKDKLIQEERQEKILKGIEEIKEKLDKSDKYQFKKWKDLEKANSQCDDGDGDSYSVDVGDKEDKKKKKKKKKSKSRNKNKSKLRKIGRFGRVAGVVGAGVAVVGGVSDYQDAKNTAERETVVGETIGEAGGAIAGAEAGASAGAVIGATIGSAVPVIGTTVGAGAGAIIGGIGGGIAGSSIGKRIGRWISSLFHDPQDDIPDSIKRQGVMAEIFYIDQVMMKTLSSSSDIEELNSYRQKLVKKIPEQLKKVMTFCSRCRNDKDRAIFVIKYFDPMTKIDKSYYKLIVSNLKKIVDIELVLPNPDMSINTPNRDTSTSSTKYESSTSVGQTKYSGSSTGSTTGTAQATQVSTSTQMSSGVPSIQGSYNADTYTKAVFKIESGYDYPDPRGFKSHTKGSSYYGGFQFSKSSSAPYLKKINKNWQDYLNDPKVQEQVFNMETEQNRTILRNKGVPITNTSLWMAHNVGIGTTLEVFTGKVSSRTLKFIRNQAGMNSNSTVNDYISYYAPKFGEKFKSVSEIKSNRSGHSGSVTGSIAGTAQAKSSRSGHSGGVTGSIAGTAQAKSSRSGHSGGVSQSNTTNTINIGATTDTNTTTDKPTKTPETTEDSNNTTKNTGAKNTKYRGKTWQLPKIKSIHKNRLDQLNAQFGGKEGLFIVSGYRSPAYNAKVGGAKNSYHMKGLATDISIAGWSSSKITQFLKRAVELGCKGFGYYHSNKFIHIDSRPTASPVVWNKSSTPKQYLDAIYGTKADPNASSSDPNTSTVDSNASSVGGALGVTGGNTSATFSEIEADIDKSYELYKGNHLNNDTKFIESGEVTSMSTTTDDINSTLKKNKKSSEPATKEVTSQVVEVHNHNNTVVNQQPVGTTALDLIKNR